METVGMAQKSKRTNFDNVLQMVREAPESVFARYARMLSGLPAEKIAKLRSVLSEMTAERRSAFYNAMEDMGTEFFEYDFAPIAVMGMEDPEGAIRAISISTLGLEESPEIGAKILDAAENDPDEQAQAAAVSVLGQYMFDDVIEEPIPVSPKKLHSVLEKLIEHKNPLIRRAAVISYAISETDRVNEIIAGYLAGNEREELVTALRAIRISLNEDKGKSVLELINHEDEEVVTEAVRAAGALQLRESLPVLYEIISRFDRISPDLLLAAADAVAEIGDESSIDVLETLGEAVVDMDEEITESIDDCIDTLNMTVNMDFDFDEDEKQTSHRKKVMLDDAIELAKDRCLSILEEKIPHDLEDDEALDFDEDDDEDCDCGEHHHHHHHHEHDHDNPLKGLDPSRFRILDDLESYESAARHDADEEDLWAEFEDMAEEDLDADSLQDFINKLEARKKGKK